MNERLLQPLKGVCMGIMCQPPSRAPSVVQPQRCHMSPGITARQPQPLFCRKRARGHLSPPSPSLRLLLLGTKLLHNSQCLGAEGVWLWYAAWSFGNHLWDRKRLCQVQPLWRDWLRVRSCHLYWAKMHWIDLRVSAKPVPGSSQVKPRHRMQGGMCWQPWVTGALRWLFAVSICCGCMGWCTGKDTEFVQGWAAAALSMASASAPGAREHCAHRALQHPG